MTSPLGNPADDAACDLEPATGVSDGGSRVTHVGSAASTVMIGERKQMDSSNSPGPPPAKKAGDSEDSEDEHKPARRKQRKFFALRRGTVVAWPLPPLAAQAVTHPPWVQRMVVESLLPVLETQIAGIRKRLLQSATVSGANKESSVMLEGALFESLLWRFRSLRNPVEKRLSAEKTSKDSDQYWSNTISRREYVATYNQQVAAERLARFVNTELESGYADEASLMGALEAWPQTCELSQSAADAEPQEGLPDLLWPVLPVMIDLYSHGIVQHGVESMEDTEGLSVVVDTSVMPNEADDDLVEEEDDQPTTTEETGVAGVRKTDKKPPAELFENRADRFTRTIQDMETRLNRQGLLADPRTFIGRGNNEDKYDRLDKWIDDEENVNLVDLRSDDSEPTSADSDEDSAFQLTYDPSWFVCDNNPSYESQDFFEIVLASQEDRHSDLKEPDTGIPTEPDGGWPMLSSNDRHPPSSVLFLRPRAWRRFTGALNRYYPAGVEFFMGLEHGLIRGIKSLKSHSPSCYDMLIDEPSVPRSPDTSPSAAADSADPSAAPMPAAPKKNAKRAKRIRDRRAAIMTDLVTPICQDILGYVKDKCLPTFLPASVSITIDLTLPAESIETTIEKAFSDVVDTYLPEMVEVIMSHVTSVFDLAVQLPAQESSQQLRTVRETVLLCQLREVISRYTALETGLLQRIKEGEIFQVVPERTHGEPSVVEESDKQCSLPPRLRQVLEDIQQFEEVKNREIAFRKRLKEERKTAATKSSGARTEGVSPDEVTATGTPQAASSETPAAALETPTTADAEGPPVAAVDISVWSDIMLIVVALDKCFVQRKAALRELVEAGLSAAETCINYLPKLSPNYIAMFFSRLMEKRWKDREKLDVYPTSRYFQELIRQMRASLGLRISDRRSATKGGRVAAKAKTSEDAKKTPSAPGGSGTVQRRMRPKAKSAKGKEPSVVEPAADLPWNPPTQDSDTNPPDSAADVVIGGSDADGVQ